MGKRNLRVATQILTGHADLNYHLRKLNRDIAPTCFLCQEENETRTSQMPSTVGTES